MDELCEDGEEPFPWRLQARQKPERPGFQASKAHCPEDSEGDELITRWGRAVLTGRNPQRVHRV